jgi:hypothetical protein
VRLTSVQVGHPGQRPMVASARAKKTRPLRMRGTSVSWRCHACTLRDAGHGLLQDGESPQSRGKNRCPLEAGEISALVEDRTEGAFVAIVTFVLAILSLRHVTKIQQLHKVCE